MVKTFLHVVINVIQCAPRPIKNSMVQGIFVYQGIHHVFKRSMNLWLQFLWPTPLGSPRVKFIYVKGECTLVLSIGFLFVIEN
jgi:hypothetical protein